MRTRTIFSIVILTMLGATIIIVPTIIFLILPSIENGNNIGINYTFMYPDPLFYNGTLGDMVLENDDRIRFLIHSSNASYNTPAYLIIDHEQNNCSYGVMSHVWYGTPHQLRIGITPSNQSIAYLFVTDPTFFLKGKVYLLTEAGWNNYQPIEDWPNPYSSAYKRAIFNWNFMPSGKINVAFVYSDYGSSTTPAIYNETTNSFLLLSDIFSEIQGSETIYAFGDFQVVDSNIFVLWERYIDSNHFHPYLAIKWQDEGWQLTTIGGDSETLNPLMIVPQEDLVNVFYFDGGVPSQNSRLYRMQIYNSTYNTTTLVTQFDGRMSLRYDSVKSLSPNEFVFFYQKCDSYLPYTEFDLYMGYYDGLNFTEIQLTDTPNLMEVRAHSEVGEEYVHYSWVSSVYKGTDSLDPFRTNIFYNRTLISDIRQLVNSPKTTLTRESIDYKDINYISRYLSFSTFETSIVITRKLQFLVINKQSKWFEDVRIAFPNDNH